MYTNSASDGATFGSPAEDTSGPLDATAKHVVGVGHEMANMPTMPLGSFVLFQVRPPSALDSITAPPVSTKAVSPPPRLTRVSPAIQHSEAVAQSKAVNAFPAGSPFASTVDQDSPPLSDTTREIPASPPGHEAAIQVCELLQESTFSVYPGVQAGDHLRPLSVL